MSSCPSPQWTITEWYRNKGYEFTITSSTAYDHKWIPNRNVFDSISQVVDEIFNNFLSRPGIGQPILTQYCDGKNVSCPNWMSQWGSKSLGDQGYNAIEILRNYYGSSIFINETNEISGIPSSYPGSPLRQGSSGDKVRQMQRQLNVIAGAYPLIPKIAEDGIFGPATEEAVKTFQKIFDLTQDGIVGFNRQPLFRLKASSYQSLLLNGKTYLINPDQTSHDYSIIRFLILTDIL